MPNPVPIQQVVRRMEEIAASLPPADGVARFNELYLAVTRAGAAAWRRSSSRWRA